MPDTLLLDQIAKRYGRGEFVLKNVSHRFEPGTATALAGPNGSGKTTLLRMLNVSAYPTEGHIHYGNLNIHQHPHAYLAHTGIVHDEDALPHYLSAVEVLEFVLRHRGRWGDDGEARVHQMLDAVLLDEQRERLIGTYSSGMKKKAQIAAALVTEPGILLLDEPLRGLDVEARAAILGLFQAFKQAGGIIIMASHLHETIADLIDEVIQLGDEAGDI